MPDLTPEVLETLYDESPDPVFVFAPVREDGRVVDFRYLYANSVAARSVGTSPAVRFAQRPARRTRPTWSARACSPATARTMETGEPTDRRLHVRLRRRRRAGSASTPTVPHPRWSCTSGTSPPETETRDALRQTEADRDRTELRRAALESLLAQVPAEMAYVRGPELVYEFVNERYRARHPGREFLGRPHRRGAAVVA